MSAWWPLDETAGSSAADVVGANHGAIQGGATVANPARVGPGRDFDGSSGMVVVPHSTTLDPGSGDFSIDAWIKPETDAVLPIVTKQFAPADAPLGYALYVENGQLRFALDSESGSVAAGSPALLTPDGSWHLVAVALARGSPTGGSLYVDGALVSTFDTTPLTGPLDTTAGLLIGSQPALGRGLRPLFFNGGIDEVEVFQRELTAAEVLTIYEAGSLGKCGKPALPQSPRLHTSFARVDT
jgi:hypothetical protein